MEEQRDQRRHRRSRRKRRALKSCTFVAAIILCSFILWQGISGILGKDTPPVANQPVTILPHDRSEKPARDTNNTPEEPSEDQALIPIAPVVESETAWHLILVNNQNPIPKNYEVKLVEVNGGEKVDKRIYKPLMQMLEAAKEGNWDQLPMVVSGYRPQEKQQKLYDDKVETYRNEGYSQGEAVKLAEQWVALPGYSEHQLGIAVDINGATYDVYQWLKDNSYKYGFIQRYTADKTNLTGVSEEVWHYRYVGVEAATAMYNQNICLEEYLDDIKN